MAAPFLLERETREVEFGGRRFRLTEMSGADLRRYVELQLHSREHVVSDLAESEEARLEEAMDRWAAAQADLFLWLLRDPADGGSPADAALVDQLTWRMRLQLIQAQDEINSLEAIAGNAVSLLTLASARREAQKISASAGPNSSPSSPSDTPE